MIRFGSAVKSLKASADVHINIVNYQGVVRTRWCRNSTKNSSNITSLGDLTVTSSKCHIHRYLRAMGRRCHIHRYLRAMGSKYHIRKYLRAMGRRCHIYRYFKPWAGGVTSVDNSQPWAESVISVGISELSVTFTDG